MFILNFSTACKKIFSTICSPLTSVMNLRAAMEVYTLKVSTPFCLSLFITYKHFLSVLQNRAFQKVTPSMHSRLHIVKLLLTHLKFVRYSRGSQCVECHKWRRNCCDCRDCSRLRCVAKRPSINHSEWEIRSSRLWKRGFLGYAYFELCERSLLTLHIPQASK